VVQGLLGGWGKIEAKTREVPLTKNDEYTKRKRIMQGEPGIPEERIS